MAPHHAAKAAGLRLVTADDVDQPTIEAELAALFATEAQLTHSIGDVRRAIYDARQRLAQRDRLLVPPRYELLRQRLYRDLPK